MDKEISKTKLAIIGLTVICILQWIMIGIIMHLHGSLVDHIEVLYYAMEEA